MKKTLIKKKSVTAFLSICIIALFSVSCSSDDNAEQDPEVVFTKFDVSKTDVFTEDKILIEFEGNGYTEAALTSDNPAVVVTKKAATVYEISSAASANAYIYVALNNKTKKASKGVNISFNEHGVKDFNSIEGIKVNVDKSSKAISLLGEPDLKADTADGLSELWTYGSKGLGIIITKKTSIVDQIDALSSNYFYTKNDVQINYVNYLYEIGNGWKINNINYTMDMVIAQLGTLYTKSSAAAPSTNRTYKYANKQIAFSFYSNSEDDYTGKKIVRFAIY